MAIPKTWLPVLTAMALAFIGALRITVAFSAEKPAATEGGVTEAKEAADPTAPGSAKTTGSEVALGPEQAKLAAKYKELERVVLRMAEVMQSTDPKRAALLRQAFAQSKERQIDSQFEDLVKLLQQDQLYQATKGQAGVQQDLNRLLQLLMSGDREKQIPSERAEIKRFIERINKLIREQQGIQGETEGQGDEQDLAKRQDKIANKAVDLARDLNQFDDQNNPNVDKKGDAKENSPGPNGEKSEGEKSEGDQKSGDEKSRSKDGKKSAGKKSDSKSGEKSGKSGDEKSKAESEDNPDGSSDGKGGDNADKKSTGKSGKKNADGKQSDAKKSAGKSDGKQSDERADDANPEGKSDAKGDQEKSEGNADGKSGGKNSEGKSGSKSEKKSGGEKNKKSGDKSSKSQKSGDKSDKSDEKSSDQKSDNEKSDSEKSDQQKSDQQKSDQQKSDQQKSDEQKSSGEKSGGKSAQKSDSKSSKSQKGSKGAKGQPQEQPEGEQDDAQNQPNSPSDQQPDESPARKRVRQAEERMREAKRRLEDAQRRGAAQEQERAIDELKQAKAELEEILRQLREEEIERTLAMLEGRFRKMLQLQAEVYEGTIGLDRIPEEERDRDLEIESGKLSRKEANITAEADKALSLLHEEGSSVAFPESVEQMREDMESVTARLGQAKVGQITQGIEQDIIKSLEEMVASLQRAQKDQQQRRGQQPGGMKKGSGGAGQPQDRPLVNAIAELKMIRALQMRVNTRTKRYSDLLQEGAEQADQPDLVEALKRLSEREDRVRKTTHDIEIGKNR